MREIDRRRPWRRWRSWYLTSSAFPDKPPTVLGSHDIYRAFFVHWKNLVFPLTISEVSAAGIAA